MTFAPFESDILRDILRQIDRDEIKNAVFKSSDAENPEYQSAETLKFFMAGNRLLDLPQKFKNEMIQRFDRWIDESNLQILRERHVELDRRLTAVIRGKAFMLRFSQGKKALLLACEYDDDLNVVEQSLGYYAHEDIKCSETEIAVIGGYHKIVESNMRSHGISTVIDQYTLTDIQVSQPGEPVLHFETIQFKRKNP